MLALEQRFLPAHYDEVELFDVTLVGGALHIELEASGDRPVTTSNLGHTRAFVLSEQQTSMVQAALNRFQALHPDEGRQALIDSIDEQRGSNNE